MHWAGAVLLASTVVASTWLGRAIHAGVDTAPWARLVPAMWLATMAAVLVAAWARDRRRPPPAAPRVPRAADPALAMVAGLLVVGFVFRSAGLDRLAWGYAGVNLDAVYNSEIAFRILDGHQSFAPAMPAFVYVRDVFMPYWLAGFFAVGGRTIQSLRLACNVLGLTDCFLLFLILRGYTTSLPVVLGTTALYVFSGVEAVFALSGMEYVMTTPFILLSFVLFERARRRGTFGAAAVAGLVWGLGLYSHYPYLFLVPILPLIALVHLGSSRRWLGTFLLAGLVAGVPKICYLAFNHDEYFRRFVEVARHDPSGGFLVAEYFRTSARRLCSLLFERQRNFKMLLPEGPILAPLEAALAALGLVVSVRRLTRPQHLFALALVAFTVFVNLGAFVQDYRVMNAMPVVFLLVGIGLLQLERWLGAGAVAHVVLGTLVGVLVMESVSAYFTDPVGSVLREPLHYGTEEVALARSVATMSDGASPYVLVPFPTHRLDFFNLAHHGIEDVNAGLDLNVGRRYSRAGAVQVLHNVQQVLQRQAAADVLVRFVLSEQSPYADDVQWYLTGRPGVRTTAMEVTDPVAGTSTVYRVVEVPHPAAALADVPRDAGVFRAAAADPAPSAIGKLWLKTFADTEERLLRDERHVPASLDVDFERRVPYVGDWRPPFSLQWTGRLHIDHAGEYRLEATYDDGCRVFLDGRRVLDDWTIGASRTASATFALDPGWHALRIDYFQVANEAVFTLRLAEARGVAAPVPATALASDGPALQEPSAHGDP